MSETVSIIMPAYNAEQYIEESLDSIVIQDYTDWELIVVDDGSTDKTGIISDSYSRRDGRIHVIHKKNGGVCSARNAGLAATTGKYITFVDADDVIPPCSVSVRVQLMKHADLVVAGYVLTNEILQEVDRMPARRRDCWNRREAVRNIIVDGEMGYQGYLVNKLFRRSIIEENSLSFDTRLVYNEDRLFCTEYAMHCNDVRLTDEVVYYYRRVETSATAKRKLLSDADYQRFESEFLAFDQVMALVRDTYPDCYYLSALFALNSAVWLKKDVDRRENRLLNAVNRRILLYGRIALMAPGNVAGLWKKLKVLGHMILLK